MKKFIDKKLIRRLNRSLEERLYICEREPLYFVVYYFPEYLKYPLAPFHYDFYDDIKGLVNGTYDSAAWIAFRESGKSSIAKLGLVTWAICFEKKKYINVDSFMKEDAEAFLFDVAVALQTNERILDDFGNLYYGDDLSQARKERKRTKIKRINNFITENDIKVEAFSTQQSTRGRVYKYHRPDLYVLDDFETNKTKDSDVITQNIISHIDELKSGLGPEGSVLYLGNYITESGVVSHILHSIERSDKGIIRNIPVAKNGKPTWPAKYVMTNKERRHVNKIIRRNNKRDGTDKPKKISLEAKRKFLGNRTFETEMMNNPRKSGDLVFDRRVIEHLLGNAIEEEKEIAGLKIWGEFNPKHRYAIGADTAEGIGEDSNTAVVIDFSTNPARVVATFKDNKIPPDIFGYELIRIAELFGNCIIAPEINNTGFATLSVLQDEYDNIYIRDTEGTIGQAKTNKYGWRTTRGNKTNILYNLRSAVEDGHLEVLDEKLLQEMKYYSKRNLRRTQKTEGMTKHFDLLMAAAIAWAMEKEAKAKSEKRVSKFKQPDYVPLSDYQSRG